MRKLLLLGSIILISLLPLETFGQTTPTQTPHFNITIPPGVSVSQVQNALQTYQQGITYFNQQDAVSAENYLKQAIPKMEALKQVFGNSMLASVYAHTGHIALFLGKPEEAKSYLLKAQALDSKIQPVQMLTTSIQNLDISPDYLKYHGKEISRWNNQRKEIYIYINPQAPENINLVKQAFLTWQQAINNQFVFVFIDDPAYSDVRIVWVNTLRTEDGEGAAGHYIFQNHEQYLTLADIEVALLIPQGTPMPKEHMYSATLHEIGHLLGLEHSPNPSDLMHPASSVLKPSSRDISTFQALYQLKPDYTNHPQMTVAEYRQKVGY